MQILKNYRISSAFNKPILVNVFYNKTGSKNPLVIFVHGYKGYKDWGAFGKMHSYFEAKGFCLLSFNFSHNGGTPEQPIDFPDLKAFGNNNYSKELSDVNSVLNWIIQAREQHIEIDINSIYLIGHSRGGGIATLVAAKDRRIKKLVTWAAVSSLNRSFFQDGPELNQWKKEGVLYIQNGRTKQQMPHYIQFYEDYKKNQDKFNIESATKRIHIPHLIIHGNKDSSVPPSHAHNLHQWNSNSELCILSDSNHVFGAKQPWTEEALPKDFRHVLEHTLTFLLKDSN